MVRAPPTQALASRDLGNPTRSSELLLSIPQKKYKSDLRINSTSSHPDELLRETEDEDILATARGFLYSREFLRAAHLLRDRKSSKAKFVRLYSQYLVSYPYSLINAQFSDCR